MASATSISPAEKCEIEMRWSNREGSWKMSAWIGLGTDIETWDSLRRKIVTNDSRWRCIAPSGRDLDESAKIERNSTDVGLPDNGKQIVFYDTKRCNLEEVYACFQDFVDAAKSHKGSFPIQLSVKGKEPPAFKERCEPRVTPDALAPMLADIEYKHALTEIIENSIEAIMTVHRDEAACTESSSSFRGRIEIYMNYNEAVIEIRDNGVGMSEENLKHAVNLGGHKHVGGKQCPAADRKEWLCGKFGKYGIGLKCAFRFGDEIVVKIRTKQRCSKAMISAELDYLQMRTSGIYDFIVGNECPDPSIFCDAEQSVHCSRLAPLGEHGTSIRIENVPKKVWLFWGNVSGRSYSGNENFKDLCTLLAEKYYFYHSGIDDIARCLEHHGTGFAHESSNHCPIDFIIKGVQNGSPGDATISLSKWETNEVSQWVEELNNGFGDENDSEIHSTTPKPCSSSEFQIFDVDGNKHGNVRVVLFFNPCKGTVESKLVENGSKQIMVFWQELYFANETLRIAIGKTEKQHILPFMLKAKERAEKEKKGALKMAFDRVRVLLFLDEGFEPDMNKQWLANSSATYKELVYHQRKETEENYKRLENWYYNLVNKWHDEHDQPIEFIDRTIKPTTKGKYVCYWAKVRTIPLEFLIETPKGRQSNSCHRPRSGAVNERDVRLPKAQEFKVARIEMEKKNAKTKSGQKECEMDKKNAKMFRIVSEGSKVEVIKKIQRRTEKSIGQLIFIESCVSESENPKTAKLKLLPPFESLSLDSLQDCRVDELFHKLEEKEWENYETATRLLLPHSLKIWHYIGPQEQKELKHAASYRVSNEQVDAFQIKVQAFNRNGEAFEEVKVANRTLLPFKDFTVRLELLDDREHAVAVNGEEWIDIQQWWLEPPHLRGCCFSSLTNRSDDLNRVLRSRAPGAYVLQASLHYEGKNEYVSKFFNEQRILAKRSMEVEPGMSEIIRLFNDILNLIWCGAGVPAFFECTIKQLKYWFQIELDDVIISFKDRNERLISGSSLLSRHFKEISLFWTVMSQDANTGETILRQAREEIDLDSVGDDRRHSFLAQGLKIRTGWNVKNHSRAILIFEAEIAPESQIGETFQFKQEICADVQSGIPTSIVFENVDHNNISHNEPLKGSLRIVDAWDNDFALSNALDARLQVRPCKGVKVALAELQLSKGRIGFNDLGIETCARLSLEFGTIEFSVICKGLSQQNDLGSFSQKLEFRFEELSLEFDVPRDLRISGSGLIIQHDGSSHSKVLQQIYLKLMTDGNIKQNIPATKKISLTRKRMNECEDSRLLEVKHGRSEALGALIETKTCGLYTAEIEGLKTSLELRVVAGVATRAVLMKQESPFYIGRPCKIMFQLLDHSNVATGDKRFDTELSCEVPSLQVQTHGDVESEFDSEGNYIFCMNLEFTGQIPEVTDVTLELCVRISNGDVVKDKMFVNLLPGSPSKLIFHDHSERDELASIDYVSGEILMLGLAVVDEFGNKNMELTFSLLVKLIDAHNNVVLQQRLKLDSGGATFEYTWKTPCRIGLLTAEVVRNKSGNKSQQRISDGQCKVNVQPGSWPAELHLYSEEVLLQQFRLDGTPQQAQTPLNLDDASQNANSVSAVVMADNGSLYKGDMSVTVELDGLIFQALRQNDGNYAFQPIKVPSKPGSYNGLIKVEEINSHATFQLFFTVERNIGTLKSIEILSYPRIVQAAQTPTEPLVVALKNRLGVNLLQCSQFEFQDQDFEFRSSHGSLTVQGRHANACKFDLKITEVGAAHLRSTINCKVYMCINTGADSQMLESQPIEIEYYPLHVLEHDKGKQIKLRKRILELETALNANEDSVHKLEQARNKLSKITPLAELQEKLSHQEALVQDLEKKRYYTKTNLYVESCPALQAFLQDMEESNILPAEMKLGFRGVVAELGKAKNELDMHAISAIAGPALQTVVFDSETFVNRIFQLAKQGRYKTLRCMALGRDGELPRNLVVRNGQLAFNQEQLPRNGKYAVNAIVLEPEYESLRCSVWYHILGKAVIFRREKDMEEHIEQFGRTHTMVCPAGQGQWRVTKGKITIAGQTAKLYAHISSEMSCNDIKEVQEARQTLADMRVEIQNNERSENTLHSEIEELLKNLKPDHEIKSCESELENKKSELKKLSLHNDDSQREPKAGKKRPSEASQNSEPSQATTRQRRSRPA